MHWDAAGSEESWEEGGAAVGSQLISTQGRKFFCGNTESMDRTRLELSLAETGHGQRPAQEVPQPRLLPDDSKSLVIVMLCSEKVFILSER